MKGNINSNAKWIAAHFKNLLAMSQLRITSLVMNTLDEIMTETHHTLALKLGLDYLNREAKLVYTWVEICLFYLSEVKSQLSY